MLVWSQTKRKKTLVEFKSGGGTSQRIMSSQTLRAHLSRSVAVLLLEVLEQSREIANLHKKYNWQRASTELAICKAHEEGAGRGQEYFCMHYIIVHCRQKY